MNDDELRDWLNAVIDAQVEVDRKGDLSMVESDEAWCFFRDWLDDFKEEAWNRFVKQDS